ncbi:PAS domain S-box protein [Kaistia terrae]|uniref:Blue-light-activated histidine kinase n=1 Tax=Kaistia terrae TaxID=537017 RepID=A0ABW0PPR6_9HYPH|nr:PAS domain S-box protein [Kaistia terrae]MCX5577849.1 PAS domain S-box protein [Kaistia terrae]
MGSAFDAVIKDTSLNEPELTDLARMAQSLGQIRDFVDALPAAIYTVDAQGWITSYNEAAAALWGRRPVLNAEQWCGAWRLYRPDGSPLPHDQCPTAIALKEGRPIRAAEAIAERPDGTRVPFSSYPTPLRDGQGNIIGAVNMLVDITERKRSDLSAAVLSAIVESSHDAIISKDLNGVVVSWNAGAQSLFGYSPEEMVGKPIALLIPPDRQDEEPAILRRIRNGERVDHFETVRRRKDGSLVEISLTISPVRDRDGKIVGASKIARDISERRNAEQQQRLIVREMSHRIKNLFAIAGSIVSMSARSAETPAELAQAVRQRLAALTRAHELTRPGLIDDIEPVSGAQSLRTLIEAIMLPYRDGEGETGLRLVLAGPELFVTGSAIASLALVFHEFATNAAKYGALAVAEGRVEVVWSVREGMLVVDWREIGGPPIAERPQRHGFGSTLANRVVIGQFAGTLDYAWNLDGVVIHLEMQIDKLS